MRLSQIRCSGQGFWGLFYQSNRNIVSVPKAKNNNCSDNESKTCDSQTKQSTMACSGREVAAHIGVKGRI
jgi:hypothetical protein